MPARFALWVPVLLSLTWLGCASHDPKPEAGASGNSGAAEISGGFDKASFVGNPAPECDGHYPGEVVVTLGNYDACDANAKCASAVGDSSLTVTLLDESGSALAPGTYQFGEAITSTAPFVTLSSYAIDKQCKQALNPGGWSGSVTFDALSATEVTGSVDITSATGVYQGSFAARSCSGGKPRDCSESSALPLGATGCGAPRCSR